MIHPPRELGRGLPVVRQRGPQTVLEIRCDWRQSRCPWFAYELGERDDPVRLGEYLAHVRRRQNHDHLWTRGAFATMSKGKRSYLIVGTLFSLAAAITSIL